MIKNNYQLDSREVRGKVEELIKFEDLGFLKVTNTKYAKDIQAENGTTYTVRVDIVVSKDTEVNAQILSEEYQDKLREKEMELLEKQAKREAKIAKDKAKREQAKAKTVKE